MGKPQIAVDSAKFPVQRLCHWAQTSPDRVYLTQPLGGGTLQHISWAQAADQVRRMASWMHSQGWPAGSRVAILGKNSAHWVLADLAILMAGHISVPIYPTFNGDALAYILEHSEARACFVGKMDDSSSLQSVPQQVTLVALPLAPASVVGLHWDELLGQHLPLGDIGATDADAICTIIYTSGTTGRPKGVVQTFGAMAWGLASATQRIPISADDRFISYLPLAHVAERMLVEQASLRFGGHVFFAESLDTFLTDLQRARPTIFFSVPRLWVKFRQGVFEKMPESRLKLLLSIPLLGTLVRRKILKGLGLDQCQLAAGGAAPMPADVLAFFRGLGLDLIEVYGMTENCGVSHSTLPGASSVGSVGLPYEGVESRIDAQSGEIQMRCPALMQGYYKSPEQTSQSLTADGWLRTGDKGRCDAQGQLTITGRVKDIFKTSKGKYVAPAPIEDLLITHPDIEACAVTGANLTQPLAVVMLSQDAARRCADATAKLALAHSLEQHLQSVNHQLEHHERLDCLAVVTDLWTPENGFVTPTFKVKRDKIEEAYASQFDAWVLSARPVVWVKRRD
ncbi:MAG: AMP-binding protein [Rhodoferax sp.]|nr:AMP-binding protein [Rhodoferax sp.]